MRKVSGNFVHVCAASHSPVGNNSSGNISSCMYFSCIRTVMVRRWAGKHCTRTKYVHIASEWRKIFCARVFVGVLNRNMFDIRVFSTRIAYWWSSSKHLARNSDVPSKMSSVGKRKSGLLYFSTISFVSGGKFR